MTPLQRYVDGYKRRQRMKEDVKFFEKFDIVIEDRKQSFNRKIQKIKNLYRQFTDFNMSIINKQLEANEFVTDLKPKELNNERIIFFDEWKS